MKLFLVDSEVAPMPSFDDLDKIVSASGIHAKPAGDDAFVPGMYLSWLLKVVVRDFYLNCHLLCFQSPSGPLYKSLFLQNVGRKGF